MSKLTESQFHTVWTEAVGRDGYNKELFQETLHSLRQKGMIITEQAGCQTPEDSIKAFTQ